MDNDTIKDANGLLAAVETFSFLATLAVVKNIMSYLKSITKLLQEQSLNIVHSIELVGDLQQQMKQYSDNVEVRAQSVVYKGNYYSSRRNRRAFHSKKMWQTNFVQQHCT